MNTLIFLFYSFILCLSIFGYGKFYRKYALNNTIKSNLTIDGIYGLLLIFVLSGISHIFFSHNYIHNSILHIIGIFLFVINFKFTEFENEFKLFIIIYLVLLSSLFIGKTNEDFPYYHLPFSIQLSEQSLQFGLGHLNHGFKQFSSIFLLNSTFHLPFIEFYLFNFIGFFIQVIFYLFLFNELFYNKNSSLSKAFIILTIIFFLAKFKRLSEFGTDIPGQMIILISFFYLIKFIFMKERDYSSFYISLVLTVFAITTKSMYIIYSIIPLIIITKSNQIYLFLKNLFFSKDILLLFLSFLILFIFNFSSTGCFLYPVSFTCFPDLASWGLKNETIEYMNLHYETWSKSLSGAGYSIENKEFLLENFQWINIWIKNYFFNKVSDYLLLILFIFLTFYFSFKKNFIELKENFISYKDFIFVYAGLLIIFFIWFLNFPTLRYAGYLIVYLIFVFPFLIIIFRKKKFNFKNDNLSFKILLSLVLIIFNYKNIERIVYEVKMPLESENNLRNFPFFFVKKPPYEKILIDKFEVNHILNNDMCWSTPSTCIKNKNFKIEKKFNFKFYIPDE
jgi:hypothetical protein